MESVYTLNNTYSDAQPIEASYTRGRFVLEEPLQAEELLADVTTRLEYAEKAYEALVYGNQQNKHSLNLSRADQDRAMDALYRYKEMLDAYYAILLILQEEAGVNPTCSRWEAWHDRVHSFLRNLLLAWVERMSR